MRLLSRCLDVAVVAGLSAAAVGSWERLEHAVSSRRGSFPTSFGRHGDPAVRPRAVGEEVEEPTVRAACLAARRRHARRCARRSLRSPSLRMPNAYVANDSALLASWQVRADLFEVRAPVGPRSRRPSRTSRVPVHASRDNGNHARRPRRRMERHSKRQTTLPYCGEINHFRQ